MVRSQSMRPSVLTLSWAKVNELANSPQKYPIREAEAMRQVEPKAASMVA